MAKTAAIRPWILPFVVVGQLLATSTWFAANAVIAPLQSLWAMDGGEGLVTTAVQVGFIAGTLVFAIGGIADRSTRAMCSSLPRPPGPRPMRRC